MSCLVKCSCAGGIRGAMYFVRYTSVHLVCHVIVCVVYIVCTQVAPLPEIDRLVKLCTCEHLCLALPLTCDFLTLPLEM